MDFATIERDLLTRVGDIAALSHLPQRVALGGCRIIVVFTIWLLSAPVSWWTGRVRNNELINDCVSGLDGRRGMGGISTIRRWVRIILEAQS